MEGQLEYFDLHTIKRGYNYLIMGPNVCGKNILSKNIINMLSNRKCAIGNAQRQQNGIDTQYYYYNKSNKLKLFNIIVYDPYSAPFNYGELDIVFVHSQFIHKKIVIQRYFNNGYTCNDINYINIMENYSSPYTFFVLQNFNIPTLCKAEHDDTYLTTFNDKSFDYNNVKKLTNNILNNFSVYHKKNKELHLVLQSRLDQLNQIYNGIFCLNNNDVWIPSELNLEIIKLLFLLY